MTFEDDILKLGQRISKLRKRRGLTIEKLAYEMGISKGHLSELERGKGNPTLKNLRLIADGLEVPLAQLFKE